MPLVIAALFFGGALLASRGTPLAWFGAACAIGPALFLWLGLAALCGGGPLLQCGVIQ